MLQMATKPLPQPTAMSLGESHAIHVQTVEGGFASKTGEWTFTMTKRVSQLGISPLNRTSKQKRVLGTEFCLFRAPADLDVQHSDLAISPDSRQQPYGFCSLLLVFIALLSSNWTPGDAPDISPVGT